MLGGIEERSSRQGRSLAGCKSPYSQLPVIEHAESFCVQDAGGQTVGMVLFPHNEETPHRAKVLTFKVKLRDTSGYAPSPRCTASFRLPSSFDLKDRFDYEQVTMASNRNCRSRPEFNGHEHSVLPNPRSAR
jgi:hypothetical protein